MLGREWPVWNYDFGIGGAECLERNSFWLTDRLADKEILDLAMSPMGAQGNTKL